jgi:AcrR family transcriptional regulator
VTAHFLSGRVIFVLRDGPEPQQLRAHASRARLIEAATACLIELGLAGASTARVAARAGLSQGAVFKHFPTKDALLGAAVEHILARFIDAFARELAPAILASADPIAPVCAGLWRIFCEPAMRAVFEIYVAAHTDAALAARLAPILARHRAAIFALARRIFPTQAAAIPAADFEGAVDAIVLSMQGAALGPFTTGQPDAANHLAFLERLARRELAIECAPARPTPSPRAARRRPT